MATVLVIDERDTVAESLIRRLEKMPLLEGCRRARHMEGGYGELFGGGAIDTVVYSPLKLSGGRTTIDLANAEALFHNCARRHVKRLILLSSAEVYGASCQNPGLVSESKVASRNGGNSVARQWSRFESLAEEQLGRCAALKLAILRPVIMPLRGGADYYSRLFSGRLAATLPGHDPSIQILSLEDLASAVCLILEKDAEGTYNVAPDGVIPLRLALRLARTTRVPVPRWLQRLARRPLVSFRAAHPGDRLDYIRYGWTVSNGKIKRELGFKPTRSSAEALAECAATPSGGNRSNDSSALRFDDFGMDEQYIAAYSRRVLNFLERYYWRVEVDGIEEVPREGRAVLVGFHRGFMPWDGAMVLHLLAREVGRYPRFLIHPGLLKFPFMFNCTTKMGGIIACRENSDYVLSREGMLGIFPEGVHGPFRLYRDAYRLGKFGRNDFVKIALRNRAPILPFVTVGSAEIFPIIGKLEWDWWKKYSDWPFIPVTPTFPFLPVPIPLPSKWHIQFLAPLHIESRYEPADADDPATVASISLDVRGRMERAIQQMLSRRRSIFYGSVFDRGAC